MFQIFACKRAWDLIRGPFIGPTLIYGENKEENNTVKESEED